jgi:hypothetical protein
MTVFRIAAMSLIGISGGLFSPIGSLSKADAAGRPHESPFACNTTALDPAARRRHFDELGPALKSAILAVRELPDGYELDFPGDAGTYRKVTEWTAGERLCCPFFDIDVRSARENGTLTLRLSGRKGVKQFIEIDGAEWIRRR